MNESSVKPVESKEKTHKEDIFDVIRKFRDHLSNIEYKTGYWDGLQLGILFGFIAGVIFF